MRKSLAIKTLLRSPLKTLLTFLLIAAASFALFSRVTDYVITSREAAKAQSLYHGVAAFDNSVEPVYFEYQEIETEPIPWPSDEQLEEIASLPGVTLADTRYTTDGLIEDYKRVIGEEDSYMNNVFVVEGTYTGYQEYDQELEWSRLYLELTDVEVHAGDIYLNSGNSINIAVQFYMGNFQRNAKLIPREYFDELKPGTRYLMIGTYSERTGGAFELGTWYMDLPEDIVEIEGLGENYLETEEFSEYKGAINAVRQSRLAYDIVYTEDMRAIPYVNEHKLAVSRGRALTREDEGACVVSELFLDTYGLSVGDKINIRLGDRLEFSGWLGSRPMSADTMAEFPTSAELTIIGAFRYNNDAEERANDLDWRYGPATIFVPRSLLTVEIPDKYEIGMGQYSIFIEDPDNIEAFREAAEPMAANLNLAMRFSDGGWSGMKDSIESGSLTSLLTTILYVMGAALALFLAVYLYVGRNQKSYAIMRTLGVPGRKAGNSMVLPLGVLSVLAMAFGGMAGLFYAARTAAETLAGMSDSSMPEGMGYVPDVTLPVDAVVVCLICELAFVFLLSLAFLWKMKKTPPLELMHEGKGHAGAKTELFVKAFAPAKHATEIADTAPVPAGLNLADLMAVENVPTHGNYHALRQVPAYILRHMRRGIGKTAVSLILTVVLTAGIGTFVLARLMYHDACRETIVKGRAMNFASTSIEDLEKSDLAKDVYYYTRLGVRVNGSGAASSITFTNDLDRYLLQDHKVTYAEGYGWSDLAGVEPVCLMEQSLAEELGVSLGDQITMMSDDLYVFMPTVYEEDRLEAAIQRAGKPYKVVGILETEEEKGEGIFTSVNDWAQKLYGQPFVVGYCEFSLVNNAKVKELDGQLEELKADGMKYAKGASYHIDSEVLKSTMRTRDLLDSLFPIAVAAAVLIGLFGPGLVIMQSAQEAAFLRILGVTKKRARCMLILEQMVLCIVGIAFVAVILVAFAPGLFLRGTETLAFCWMLYFLGCICGASASAIQVTRYRILELLQVK